MGRTQGARTAGIQGLHKDGPSLLNGTCTCQPGSHPGLNKAVPLLLLRCRPGPELAPFFLQICNNSYVTLGIDLSPGAHPPTDLTFGQPHDQSLPPDFALLLFRAAPAAHGGSQARGHIGAAAASPHPSSWQHQILNPLSEARDRIRILTDTSWVLNLLSHSGNSSASRLSLAGRIPGTNWYAHPSS